MNSNLKILRYISYAVEILLFYVISGIPGLLPPIFGIKPVLLLPIAITIAVFENENTAMVCGLFCGALCDVSLADRIGFYTISLTILCFFFGYCARNFFVTNFANAMAIGATTIFVLLCLYFVLFRAASGIEQAGLHFFKHYFVRILYTLVFLPPFFWLNKLLRTSMA